MTRKSDIENIYFTVKFDKYCFKTKIIKIKILKSLYYLYYYNYFYLTKKTILKKILLLVKFIFL